MQFAEPSIKVGRARVILPPGSFLQATHAGEQALVAAVLAATEGARRVLGEIDVEGSTREQGGDGKSQTSYEHRCAPLL